MKLTIPDIKKTPIAFIIMVMYGISWIVSIAPIGEKLFKIHEWNNIALGYYFILFSIYNLFITVTLFIGLLIARKLNPDKKNIYKVYAIYLFLPYFIIISLYGFNYAKFHYSNSYVSDKTNFNFTQNHMQNIVELESSLSSDRIIIDRTYYLSNKTFPHASKSKLAQPIIFQRKNISLIPLQIEYFFSEKDSIMKCILYNWSDNHPNNKVSGINNIGYQNKYKALVHNLKTKLGSPMDISSDLNQDTNDKFNNVWKTNNLVVKLTMYLSPNKNRHSPYNRKQINCIIYWDE